MPDALKILRYLLRQPQAYCEACLGAALACSPGDIHRLTRGDDSGLFTNRYGVCPACTVEKEVIGPRGGETTT